MRARRWFTVVGMTTMLVLTLAGTAVAQSRGGSDAFVVLTGQLVVPKNVTFVDAVIFDGDAVVDGTVTNSVTVFNGDLTVSGTVGGDVTVLNGLVVVEDGATIGGNINSSRAPEISETASVAGDVNSTDFDVNLNAFGVASRLAWWFGTSLATFLIGLALTLALPRAAEASAEAARQRVGPTIGWGAVGLFGVPVMSFIAVVIIVTALLGVAVLLSLGLVYLVGYVAGALALGRLILKPPTHRFLAFLLGWGILRLVGLVPFLGGLAFWVAAGWGLGALIVAGYRAAKSSGASAVPAAPPLPPMPAGP